MTFGKKVRFIDLFAGIGGFHHAALKVFPDAECVMAVELDDDCKRVYSATFEGIDLRGDIRDVLSVTKSGLKREATTAEILSENLVPEHDILFAGFPCQPFSKGGVQAGLTDSTRGTLFHEIIRIVDARRPSLVVLENVSNLVGHDEGRTWSTVIDKLQSLNYSVDSQPLVVSPHKIRSLVGGTPQNRPRVYIVAANKAKGLTAPQNSRLFESDDLVSDTSSWDLAAFLGGTLGQAIPVSEQEHIWLSAWDDFVRRIPVDETPSFPVWVDSWYGTMKLPGRVKSSVASIRKESNANRVIEWGSGAQFSMPIESQRLSPPQWWSDIDKKNRDFYSKHSEVLDSWVEQWEILSFPDTRRKFEWQAKSLQREAGAQTIRDCLIQLRPSGVRVRPSTYAPALIAMNQASILGTPSGWKKLGPAHAARLQGFPDEDLWRRISVVDKSFNQNSALKQLGNAVHVGVTSLVLRRALERISAPFGVADQLRLPLSS